MSTPNFHHGYIDPVTRQVFHLAGMYESASGEGPIFVEAGWRPYLSPMCRPPLDLLDSDAQTIDTDSTAAPAQHPIVSPNLITAVELVPTAPDTVQETNAPAGPGDPVGPYTAPGGAQPGNAPPQVGAPAPAPPTLQPPIITNTIGQAATSGLQHPAHVAPTPAVAHPTHSPPVPGVVPTPPPPLPAAQQPALQQLDPATVQALIARGLFTPEALLNHMATASTVGAYPALATTPLPQPGSSSDHGWALPTPSQEDQQPLENTVDDNAWLDTGSGSQASKRTSLESYYVPNHGTLTVLLAARKKIIANLHWVNVPGQRGRLVQCLGNDCPACIAMKPKTVKPDILIAVIEVKTKVEGVLNMPLNAPPQGLWPQLEEMAHGPAIMSTMLEIHRDSNSYSITPHRPPVSPSWIAQQQAKFLSNYQEDTLLEPYEKMTPAAMAAIPEIRDILIMKGLLPPDGPSGDGPGFEF